MNSNPMDILTKTTHQKCKEYLQTAMQTISRSVLKVAHARKFTISNNPDADELLGLSIASMHEALDNLEHALEKIK